MTLLDAQKNKIYTITKIGGDELLHRRLLDMGFTPGTKIYVAAVAPFGGTIMVALRGFMTVLREDAASLLFIEAAL